MTKFSLALWAVKSSVPSSILDPEDKSVPPEETEPDSTFIVSVDRSESTTPLILIEPDEPEASGAKEINV